MYPGFTLRHGKSLDRYSDIAQVQAQAACVALNNKSGWTFAVRRECNSKTPSCAKICRRIRSTQAKKRLKCFNALHIYSNTGFKKPHKKGLK